VNADTPVLECVNVTRHFGGVRAVEDVTIQVRAGEIVGLVGPNGAGKTTLVDLICGVQLPDRGSIRAHGQTLRGSSASFAQVGRLARTFQHSQVARELTVRENILVGLMASRLSGAGSIVGTLLRGLVRPRLAEADRQIRDVADALNIHHIERRCSELTMGEMRLVEVARALMQAPRVLLLDEPFAGSDAHGVAGVSSALREILRRGCAVILVDHNVDIVASLVERIVLMNQGQVVFDGPTRECLASGQMREVYFGSREVAA
jgi:branched-chain amino acid transport system ATP-binding protein